MMSSIKQTVKPGAKQLFCKPDEAEKKTASGFLLAESATEKPKTAEVVNIGAEVKHYASKDRIIYKPYSITEIKLNNEDFFLVDESDVLGTVIDVAE
jgi:chaperonin GroES